MTEDGFVPIFSIRPKADVGFLEINMLARRTTVGLNNITLLFGSTPKKKAIGRKKEKKKKKKKRDNDKARLAIFTPNKTLLP